jgi:hypothetical protein
MAVSPDPEKEADNDEEGTKWLSARIDPSLKRRADQRADELGMTTSEYLLALIRTDLESAE